MRYYIIMADIINSSGMPGKQLMTHFKTVVNKVNTTYKKEVKSPLTITLGDEFQGVVSDLKAAVEIIFHLDQLLLKIEPEIHLRYIVNYGLIETKINSKNAHEMLGEGLTEARELLNELKDSDDQILMAGEVAEPKKRMLNMAFKLYRSLYNDWKNDDRPIAAHFLEVEDYKVVAKAFKKDPSTMWRRKRSLKIDEFKTSRALITALADE